jgi:ribosomal protein L37E
MERACVLCGNPATTEIRAKRHPRDIDPPWLPYCRECGDDVYHGRKSPPNEPSMSTETN